MENTIYNWSGSYRTLLDTGILIFCWILIASYRFIGAILIECRAKKTFYIVQWWMAQLCLTHFPAECEHLNDLLIESWVECRNILDAHYSNMLRNALSECIEFLWMPKDHKIIPSWDESRIHSSVFFLLPDFNFTNRELICESMQIHRETQIMIQKLKTSMIADRMKYGDSRYCLQIYQKQ